MFVFKLFGQCLGGEHVHHEHLVRIKASAEIDAEGRVAHGTPGRLAHDIAKRARNKAMRKPAVVRIVHRLARFDAARCCQLLGRGDECNGKQAWRFPCRSTNEALAVRSCGRRVDLEMHRPRGATSACRQRPVGSAMPSAVMNGLSSAD